MAEKITAQKIVALKYVLKRDDNNGEVIETTDPANPFKFLFGTGQLLPEFEKNITGLGVGEPFKFGIPSKDAYGDIIPGAVTDLPLDIFKQEGKVIDELKVGAVMPMQDDKGNYLQGKVLDIADETVKLDFNHPMAGTNLYFEGEILEVREASEEELSHGHAH